MSEHVIDSSEPYHPEKLEKKDYVGAAAYFELDLRTGIILKVEEFPEMRKPCLLYTSPSPRDRTRSRMPSSA